MTKGIDKRPVDTVVISDIHLGTYGCHAKELNQYLKSIQPKKLILNGDIIDIWQFRKRYFPKSHLKVLKRFISMASKGTEVYYLTGNHDEFLRRFTDLHLGNIHLLDKLVLPLEEDKKAWIFHGDIFDASIHHAKWIAKLGGWGYDFLILLNRATNWFLDKMGKERYSLSKKIKNSVKKAVSFITDFEETAISLALSQGYDYVICGHIHQPQQRVEKSDNAEVMYLNSGDWIENLTALEYDKGEWSIYQHPISSSPEDLEADDVEWPSLDLHVLMEKVTEPTAE
ncbi:MAG: UDP-2,3-diacylglucosamine diphosphatase [Schleiferiaceae bacterium]